MYVEIFAKTVFSVSLALCVKMELHGSHSTKSIIIISLLHGKICLFFMVWNHNETNNTENGNHAPSHVSFSAWNSNVFIVVDFFERTWNLTLEWSKRKKFWVHVCYPTSVCDRLGILFVSVTYRTGMSRCLTVFSKCPIDEHHKAFIHFMSLCFLLRKE